MASREQEPYVIEMVNFNIEELSSQKLVGWAHDPTPDAGPIKVTVGLVNGTRTVEANLYRKDLEDAGFGDGRSGFIIILERNERIDPYQPIIFQSGSNELAYVIPPRIQRALAYDLKVNQFLNNGECIFECVLVLIIKNEAIYIEEWIEYHRSIGVDHFVIFDNESTDKLIDVLLPYVKLGLVTVINWPNLSRATAEQRKSGWLEQDTAYDCAVRLLSGRAKWIGCLDIDEFVVFEGGEKKNITSFLDSYNEPLVTLFWRMFGTSGVESLRNLPVIQQFNHRSPDSERRLNKNFVRPDLVHKVVNAHQFVVGDDHVTGFTTSFQKTFGADQLMAAYQGATIHHYHTRSREEYMMKVRRGWPSNTDEKNFDWENQFKMHDTNEVEDNSVVGVAEDVLVRIKKMRASSTIGDPKCHVSPNWLLNWRPTWLNHLEIFREGDQIILEGFVVNLLSPNETIELVLHDGFGNILGSSPCKEQNELLRMNRISHAAHGFRFAVPAYGLDLDAVLIAGKDFVRVAHLSERL